MALTSTQVGVITEAEFAKVSILTTNGALVPARPLADDERRDFEIHIRRHFLETLAVQSKTSTRLRLHGRSRVLQINFRLKAPLISNERLWYFLAHFDLKAMRFTEPVFLVPSRFLHKHALHGTGRGMIQLQFKASLEPGARDKWAPYRLTLAELGPRILEVIESLQGQSTSSAADLTAFKGVIWLHRPGATSRSRRPKAP